MRTAEALPLIPPQMVVARAFDAPPAAVFAAWTDPARVARWRRPTGFESPVISVMDVRPGGVFRMRARSPEGVEYVAEGVYCEIVDEERIVCADFCREDGRPFYKALITATFDRHRDGTRLAVHASFDWIAGRDARWTAEVMPQRWADGWRDNLERLACDLAER